MWSYKISTNIGDVKILDFKSLIIRDFYTIYIFRLFYPVSRSYYRTVSVHDDTVVYTLRYIVEEKSVTSEEKWNINKYM